MDVVLPRNQAAQWVGGTWCASVLPALAVVILRRAAVEALTQEGVRRRAAIDEAVEVVKRRWPEHFRDVDRDC